MFTCIVDDIKMSGPEAQVVRAHKWLVERGKDWGYELNLKPDKTTVVPGRGWTCHLKDTQPHGPGSSTGTNAGSSTGTNANRGAHQMRGVTDAEVAAAMADMETSGRGCSDASTSSHTGNIHKKVTNTGKAVAKLMESNAEREKNKQKAEARTNTVTTTRTGRTSRQPPKYVAETATDNNKKHKPKNKVVKANRLTRDETITSTTNKDRIFGHGHKNVRT